MGWFLVCGLVVVFVSILFVGGSRAIVGCLFEVGGGAQFLRFRRIAKKTGRTQFH